VLGCLDELPVKAYEVLDLSRKIRKIANDFAQYEHCFFLSRGSGVAIAKEAALKDKEITYRHAQAMPLGELKHGSLALIDENCPSVVFVPNDESFLKNCSSIEEIRARGGKVLAISERPIESADWNIVLPE
jgi:glutamine---fructose-6-phosphate transaminase (isomerizing)